MTCGKSLQNYRTVTKLELELPQRDRKLRCVQRVSRWSLWTRLTPQVWCLFCEVPPRFPVVDERMNRESGKA
jgi:hypothetical protein